MLFLKYTVPYQSTMKNTIAIHSKEDYQGMRNAGQLAASILDRLTPHVMVGVTTEELDRLCHQMIMDAKAIPACLNYRGSAGQTPYPFTICTSINHVICHGLPSQKKLQDGDIVNIDITVIVDGYFGDTSRMYYVGKKVPIKAQLLTKTTYECLLLGIEQVRPGAKFNAIGKAIAQHAHKNGFSVVRDFCGHGIGKVFHAAPQVMHFYDPSDQNIMEEGMFFTIEPMINAGSWESKTLSDGWTAVTRDRSLSAQFEHTLAVTKDGYEIFTLSPGDIMFPQIK